MKRKGVSSGRLRLSPNEEAFVLKEDYERRRKLRLLQVREQERGIAFQIREDIKRRRYQQLTRLAEELRTEWAEAQTQKIRKLEKLYLASLRTLGEGHQQATVHEPDWKALEQQAAERKLKAEIRHKEALKVQKDQKAQAMKQRTRHLQARKDALLVEKQRSARVTRLPPPPPSLFENLDLSKISAVRPSCASYHHLSSLVNREMDAEQPDAHAAAAEEARRREDAERQASQERAERCQKAHIRGSRALTKIRLAQNQEKLLRELEQLQQEDLARRRHTVVQMPAKLLEPPYRRSERKEERQRELEFAFEDMYSAGRKVEGDLVLHLEPEPPPAMADRTRDEDLDLSVEQELPGEAASPAAVGVDPPGARGADGAPQHVPSKLLFKKLLSKIRSQKSLWTVQSECEESHPPSCAHGSSSQEPTTETEASAATQSEVPMTTTDSEPLTVESSEPLTVESSEALTVESLPPCEAEPEEDSGPLAVEGRPPVQVEAAEEAGVPEVQPVPAVESVLLHPQEEAARIRMAARRRKIMDIEEQKQKQLELLEQIERQKLRLESDRFRAQLAQLEGESRPDAQEAEGGATSTLGSCTTEDSHRQMIRSYQRHLLQQNRLHRQSVQAARKQLLQFQSMLRGTHLPAARMLPCPGPGTPGLAPEPWGTSQGAVPCPELQAFDPAQTLSLEPDHRPARRQDLVVPGRAASTDMPGAPALSQTSQTTVQPGSPGPCRALSPPTPPVSRSASEDTAAQRLTCGSHRGVSVPSSDTVATQRELLRLLQEQLDAQREVLRARQEVRLQSGQLGACFPPPLGFSAPMPPATSGPGRDPESSNLESEPGIFSDHPGDPQLRATVPSSQQPVSVSGREAPLSDEPLAGAVHVQPEPTKPLSQRSLALLPTVDTLPAELQDTTPPSEPPGPARPVSILHQFLPLHNCLKLLQAQLAIQWDALEARHAAQAQLLARRPWERGHSLAGPGSSWPPPAATSWDSGLSLPAQDRHFPPGPQDEFLPLPQREPCTPKGSLGTESETRESTQRPSEAVGGPSMQASPSQTLSQVMTSEGPREGALALFSQATTPRLQEELKSCSQRVLPAGDGVKASQEMLGHRTSESLTTGLGHPREAPDRLQAPELQARLQRLSQLLQPQREQLQGLQERLAAQRAALARTRQTAPEDRAVPRGSLATSPPTHPLPLDTSGLAALQQQLDSQKEALRARQAAQEGLLLRRLQKLEQRVRAPWPAGADGRPGPGPAHSPPNLSGLTAAQQTKPQDLLPSRPGEPILGTAVPCPRLPLPLAEAGSTDPRDTGPPRSKRAGQLWGAQTEDQEEPQGQRHEHRPPPAPQEPPSSGPARVPPECPGVPDADVAGRRLVEGGARSPVETLSCPPLLSPAAVTLAPGTVAASHPEPLHRAVPRRPLKPPVARVQSGLGLQQHELSLIREGESPTPADVCQDRDPLRVSVSREQGLLGDSLARPASAPPTPRGAASEAVTGQDAEQPGVKLGRTVGAAQTWLSPAMEPAEDDGQGTHQEPLSVTISTGSFLSAEDTDVSLTDSEPFSENAGVFGSAPLGARPRPDPMDMAALVLQREEAHREDESATARMPTLQEPGLTFPDVQHWQFQPLEPHLDLDVLSPTSGLDLFQASESSRGSRASLPSLTSPCASLRVCPHPLLTTDWPPHPGLAYTTTPHVAEPSEGFEQAFHQLLPELASEESQQVDLASILSIEARDSSECPGPHDPSGQSEQRPEDIHLQLPMGTVPTLATRSPGEACETHRSLLSPSEVLTGTQLPSTASGLCVKPREGAGETAPWAQPAASALVDRSAAQVEARTGLARLARSLSSGSSSQSRIPIWETESGRGIMEEPELTLLSLSDVSTTEMDFSTLTLDEKENEAQGSFQGSSEDSSGPCPLAVGHCMAPGTAAFPGCIQGSFREERPCQSHTSCENCQDPEEPPGPGGCLKGTSRQSCPARRRPSTQQRALRPHNYTAEVKQKEERARQDAYAWNSARAKEFHRRTLEKLQPETRADSLKFIY